MRTTSGQIAITRSARLRLLTIVLLLISFVAIGVLYYYGARYYDPRTGVWQSADPALADNLGKLSGDKSGASSVDTSAPTFLNLYNYADANPVTKTDPTGRDVENPLEAFFRFLSGLFSPGTGDITPAQAPAAPTPAAPAAPAPAAAAAPARVQTGAQHYEIVLRGAVLSGPAKAAISQVADLYYAATGTKLPINSGTRTPATQADAMYKKLVMGDDVYGLYSNKAAVSEIIRAYKEGKQAGLSSEDIKAAMTDVIKQQVARGIYISKHLQEGAVDVNINADQVALEKAVAQQGSFDKPHREEKPLHFHLQLKRQ